MPDSSLGSLRSVPYSIEAEQSVIGAILIDSNVYNDVAQILSSDDFYLDDYRDMYLAIQKIAIAGKGIDIVTLIDETVKLSDRRGRGREAIETDVRRVAEVVPIAANAKGYAKIVRDKAMLRALINVCAEVTDMAYSENGEASAIIEIAEKAIFDLTKRGTNRDFVHIRELLVTEKDKLVERQRNAEAGTPDNNHAKTGFGELDRTLVGMEPGDLVLIGARPGMGKTSFALNIAANVAHYGQKTVAIFSLEMSAEQLVERLISSDAMVDSYELRSGHFGGGDPAKKSAVWRKINESIKHLAKCEILIDDTSGMTAVAMDAKLRRVKNLGLVIIDYLQLMQSERRIENRVNEVAEISRALKLMAKRLGVPVICCAQLSRSPESRTDKRPQLSDLRDSGAIEQDADVVMFLYREDYYNKEGAGDAETLASKAQIIVAKNRHGGTHSGIEVGWNGKYTKFFPVETERTER